MVFLRRILLHHQPHKKWTESYTDPLEPTKGITRFFLLHRLVRLLPTTGKTNDSLCWLLIVPGRLRRLRAAQRQRVLAQGRGAGLTAPQCQCQAVPAYEDPDEFTERLKRWVDDRRSQTISSSGMTDTPRNVSTGLFGAPSIARASRAGRRPCCGPPAA